MPLTTVTRNKRLARSLTRQYEASQAALGLTAWETADILPLDAFLRRIWTRNGVLSTGKRLLSHAQAGRLWRRLAESGDELSNHSYVRRVSDAMYEASCLCSQWCIDIPALTDAARTQDQELFLKLLTNYRARLAKEGWLAPADLINEVAILDLSPEASGNAIELVGFLAPTRAESNLFSALEQAGWQVSIVAEERADLAKATRSEWRDRETELLAAGAWARNLLLAEPTASLAIVVPGLGQNTRQKSALICETLCGGWQLEGVAPPVNVSLGQPLNRFPVIEAIDQGMTVLRGPATFAEISRFLRNPLLAAEAGASLALIELELRSRPEQRWQVSDILAAFSEVPAFAAARQRLEVLAGLASELEALSETGSPEFWAAKFDALVTALMPELTSQVDSAEFQLLNAWRNCLNELAELVPVESQLTGDHAWQFVRERLADSVFQPESEAYLLSVLGPLEAIGQSFDAIWIASLDSQSWPQRVAANPFIPKSLQTEFRMPGGNSEHDREFSQYLLEALAARSNQVFVSSAITDDDLALTPTGVLRDLPLTETSGLGLGQVCRFSQTLSNPDALGPPVLDTPVPLESATTVRGGWKIFHLQHTFPFAGFANHRLGAIPLRSAVKGVGPLARGNAIHAAAEEIYAQFRERDVNPDELAGISRDSIVAALRRSLRAYRARADKLLIILLEREVDRDADIIETLLEIDAKRGNIRVAELEKSVQFSSGLLSVNLRVDRIDECGEGNLVIDYKTGRSVDKGQADGIPKEMQLAVYAVSLIDAGVIDHIQGIGICHLQTSAVQYEGFRLADTGFDFGRFSALKTESEPLEYWREFLTTLALRFQQGYAEVPSSVKPADLQDYRALIADLVEVERT